MTKLYEGLGGWVGLIFVKFKDRSEPIKIAQLNIEARKSNILLGLYHPSLLVLVGGTLHFPINSGQ